MADYQIGDNLYADPTLKYYNMVNGNKSYVQSPYDVSQGQINQLYDAQQKSQLDTLKAQRETALGQVNQQKTQTQQDYYNQRNQADVNVAKNVQRLRELMASNGLSASGENLTLNAQANSDRLNALNTLNTQEQAKMNDYSSQINEINNPAKDQAIVNAVAIERSKALNDAFNQAQQDIYKREMDWRDYQLKQQQLELQKQQMAMQKSAASARSAASAKASSPSMSDNSAQALSNALNAYQQAKSTPAMTALDQYYSQPAIQAGMATGSPWLRNPTSPAQSPYLNDWQKMKMLGL